MAVTETDITWYRSQNGDSEGGVRSLVEIVDAEKNNLFPDVNDASRVAGGTLVRKLFLVNEHATDSLLKPAVWMSAVPTGITAEIGLGFDDGDDDSVDQGVLAAWSANAPVSVQSDGADTRSVLVYGIGTDGQPLIESFLLDGTSELLTAGEFSRVWAVTVDAKSASRIVTIRQGAGGDVRATIPANRATAWLWVAALSQANGITIPDLIAGSAAGIWVRVAWAPNAASVRPGEIVLSYTETA